jgi:hypothetical protein
MKNMKKVIMGLAFTAVLALSLVASTGLAAAATLDTRDGGVVLDGRAQRNKPAPAKPAGGNVQQQFITASGITWE